MRLLALATVTADGRPIFGGLAAITTGATEHGAGRVSSTSPGKTRSVATTALVVVDMLNRYEHEDAEPLAKSVAGVVDDVAALVERAGADTLTAYVNDNDGAWEAGREQLVERALAGRHPELIDPIAPSGDVPFIIKGRHSIVYQTAGEELLRSHDVRRVVLVGQVTEQCVLYSALDAYLRGFELIVPPDAVAHIDADLGRAAVQMMERNMHVDVGPAAACDLVG